MVDGGEIDGDLKELALTAIAADHYGLPVFQYIEHLARTREQYGNKAARFDMEFALQVRRLRIERANEAAERARQRS